jgi:N-acetylmuramoyl-L-alanine amidase
MRIVLDPGHGGHDPGAVGPSGLEEAPVALALCELVAAELEGYELEVKMTRETDVFIELAKRCEIANDWKANYFVSVHANSNGPSAVGIETLYTSETGKALALPVQRTLVEYTGDVDRGLKERNDLYVLNGTNMPAILAEVGFISHPATETKLKSFAYRETLADAITLGVVEYLKLPPN